MPALLIKGDEVANKVRSEISAELKDLYEKTDRVPGLAVVIVGEHPASLSFVINKEKQSKKLGFYSEIHRLSAEASHEDILTVIQQLNGDDNIHGIMVQLPLPEKINEKAILDAIDPDKDVEGVHPINMGKLFSDEKGFLPCTAYSIMQMIEFPRQPVFGKSAVLISRSNIVGKPLSLLLLRRNASVTVCHSQTKDLADICREADILVTAAGKPELVKGDWVKPGAMVIDVGMTQVGDKLVGDVVFEEAKEIAGWISPVPGGVGPITITTLMKNTLEAFKKKLEI
ncbi:MAG: bifunctional 5,10-methylenetetrahydrofolate dehydrogenase/5,10-methenyltetrahydrofolate cyclohydrolase [Bacillota bacterium]|nr:bifunctional 5,10-methylenetetrahydrofolate dehydrogenase/5,10-methenyltetrahydrofolate cyclohydrolase [Bacillota bacterium]